MRWRGRIAFKIIAFVAACAVCLIVFVNYFLADAARPNDAFIVHLPPVVAQERTMQRNAEWHKAISGDTLINMTGFRYVMDDGMCRKHSKELLAIIIVTSYVGHDELRASHRLAITQDKLAEMGFQRIFLLAQIPATEKFITQEQLLSEQKRFGDLLQGNFVEAYRNLTYKHIMGLRWAATQCERAKFVVKADDDVVFDIFQLKRYLETLEVEQPQLASSSALLAGYILDTEKPRRNKANKWYVTEVEYRETTYPAFLSGWLYITNPTTAVRLVLEAQRVPFFWIDDTWVTGVLRERLNISMQRLNSWYSANAEFLQCCVRDLKQHSFECEYFVGPNGGDSKLLVEFLHNVEKCYFDECSKRAAKNSLKQTCVAAAKRILPEHGIAIVEPIKLG